MAGEVDVGGFCRREKKVGSVARQRHPNTPPDRPRHSPPSRSAVKSYSRRHVPDEDLIRDLRRRVARHWADTAELLADIAEFDARRLHAPAGYSSAFKYCVHELHLSEQAAWKR